MVYARFTPALTNVTTNKVTQWDYGRILRIEGLKLPTAVRIDFGISGSQTTKSRIGITKDGVTDVAVPDSLLEQSKNLVAYVYVNDTKEGKTVRTINIPLEARAEPEEHDSPESKALFAEAIEVINDVAVRAENAEITAKAHADSAMESLESTQQISSNFNETAANAVKAVIDAGTSQIQAVNNTKTEALKAIQEEGAAQLEHIQAAGEVIVNTAAIAEQNAKNVLANAIKGNLKGEIVVADDVSPIEHEMVVKAHGKNLIDVTKIEVQTSDNIYISAVGEGYIEITTKTGYVSNGHRQTYIKLKNLCPQMKANRNYVLSAETTSTLKMAHLRDLDYFIDFGKPVFITEAMLESYLAFYGLDTRNDTTGGVCRISNIQFEEGSTPTEYTPYIDPATVNVRRCGKNLVDLSSFEFNDSNYTHMRYAGDASADALYKFLKSHTGKSIVISMKISGEQTGIKIGSIRYYNKDSELLCAIVPYVAHTIIDLPDEYDCAYIYGSGNGATVKDIQVEFGTDATDFEPYKGTEHTLASDGTVSGMMSTAPNMTILTDTEGVVIDCEYIKDTNKVVEKLVNVIAALGGTV